jgi:hypothetical protein
MEREELHRRIMTLRQLFEEGRIHFGPDVRIEQIADSLTAIRLAPDGKVDSETVDGIARSMANTVTTLRWQNDLRQIPLHDVQVAYFGLLEGIFGDTYREMRKRDLTPQQVAWGFSQDEEVVATFLADADELTSEIAGFWEAYAPVVLLHIQELDCLKSVFGGDIFPSYTANIACSAGLYVDTVILPDPLFKALHMLRRSMKPKHAFHFIIKHALNVMSYKELALVEVDPPIVVIAPDMPLIEEARQRYLFAEAESDTLVHCSKLFGKDFHDMQELNSFLKTVKKPDELFSHMTSPDRFLIDVEQPRTPSDQLRIFQEKTSPQFASSLDETNMGEVIWLTLNGRLIQANEALYRSSLFRGSPLIDAPTSWQYLLWKYEYDADRTKEDNSNLTDAVIVKALQTSANGELELLSGIPAQALIELRQKGALIELREAIRKGIKEIDEIDKEGLIETMEGVTANLKDLLAKHKQDLDEIRDSRKRFFGRDVGSLVTATGFTIAATVTSNPLLSLISGVAGLIGIPSAKDVIKDFKDIRAKDQRIKRSPTGILFSHSKRRKRSKRKAN